MKIIALLGERLDAGEQRAIKQDLAAGARQDRRHVALDGFDLVAALCAGKIMKNRAYAIQQAPAALKGFERIGEVRRRGIVGDRGDFSAALRQGDVKGGAEMFGFNLCERRRAEGGGPRGEQGVGMGGCHEGFAFVGSGVAMATAVARQRRAARPGPPFIWRPLILKRR